MTGSGPGAYRTLVISLCTLTGCLVGQGVEPGIAGGPCFEDGTCTDGLVCEQRICVARAADATQDARDGGAGDVEAGPVCQQGALRSCYEGPAGTSGVGLCSAGVQHCVTGAWGACVDSTVPTAEICDGKDNNCDSVTDEGCLCTPGAKQPCGSDVGSCSKGTQTCEPDASWGSCIGEITPQTEVCDDEDNDCDGSTDETLMRGCYTGPTGTEGVGLCQGGTQTCNAGSWGSTCPGEVKPQTEVCDNKDNDCDGKTDALTRGCYTGPTGTEGIGLCQGGTQTCNAGSWGSTCPGEVKPTPETCNAADDDCDGQDDDGFCTVGQVCAYAAGCQSATATGICNVGAGWASGSVHSAYNDGKQYTFKDCKTKALGIYNTTFACGTMLVGGVLVYQESRWNSLVWYTNNCP